MDGRTQYRDQSQAALAARWSKKAEEARTAAEDMRERYDGYNLGDAANAVLAELYRQMIDIALGYERMSDLLDRCRSREAPAPPDGPLDGTRAPGRVSP